MLARQGRAANLGTLVVEETDGGVVVSDFRPAALAQAGVTLTAFDATRETLSLTLTPADEGQSTLSFEGRAVAGADGRPVVVGVLVDGRSPPAAAARTRRARRADARPAAGPRPGVRRGHAAAFQRRPRSRTS